MATESAASRAITRAARDVLRPMGLTQKGRSRTWLDDHGWWAIVVEFQPLAYAPGSYLNVGACWLWQPPTDDASLHFDEGHRVPHSFAPFESDASFLAAASGLAETAAHQVRSLRDRFEAPEAPVWLLERNVRKRPTDFRAAWNLAMGLALVGRLDDARSIARRERPADGYDWVVALQRELDQLGAMPDDQMRSSVRANILATRASLRLGPWDASLEV